MSGPRTWQRVRRASSRLSGQAVLEMQQLPWFAALSAEQRSWVGLVVQAGMLAFGDWLQQGEAPPKLDAAIFGAAPRELTRAVSLQQTVQLVRVAVDVVESAVPDLAGPGEEQPLREAVLRYSREVAFAAAEIYAQQAEVRGAWDARLEAGVVDALVRGRPGDLALSRASTLGWGRPGWVVAVVTGAPAPVSVEALHGLARRSRLSLLAGEVGGGLVLVTGGHGDHIPALLPLVEALPEGPVVIGPPTADLASAADSVAEAVAGFSAVSGWPQAPRPVSSVQLLVERVALGDGRARTWLLEEVHKPLADAAGDLLVTTQAYLDCGGSLEATARALFVHPNTVRYRLNKVTALLGRNPAEPREAAVLRIALILGRLAPH